MDKNDDMAFFNEIKQNKIKHCCGIKGIQHFRNFRYRKTINNKAHDFYANN